MENVYGKSLWKNLANDIAQRLVYTETYKSYAENLSKYVRIQLFWFQNEKSGNNSQEDLAITMQSTAAFWSLALSSRNDTHSAELGISFSGAWVTCLVSELRENYSNHTDEYHRLLI